MIPESVENVILVAYFIGLSILCLFGVNGYLMAHLYRKYAHKAPQPPRTVRQEWPAVTVQLPVYNELYVVERLVRATCALDYPGDRLQIQLLDDSTDETVEKSRELVAEYGRRGINIELIHRQRRAGYKAGALREALERATGQFIAIFDADFVPPQDFLRKTIPYFQNAKVGMVQTRWGHLNHGYSTLTKAQTIGLDGHFVVEQTARNRAGYFINFNGTAGVWRHRCIVDAGNWSDDTLTEDLDLSYRAQIKGWKFIFLQDVVCMSEVPASITGLKSQQFRWTKGAIETAKKILPQLWQAQLPLKIKLQGTIHLTNNLVFPFIFLVAMLNLPLLLIKLGARDHRFYFAISSVFLLAFWGSFLFYMTSQKEIYPDWQRRLAYFPVFMAGSMGLSVSNTWAILLGLFNVKSAFQRTPKYRLEKRTDSWEDKKYRGKVKIHVVTEILMTMYSSAALIVAVLYEQWSAVPFLGLFAFGFGYITTLSLKHANIIRYKSAQKHLIRISSQAKEVFQSN